MTTLRRCITARARKARGAGAQKKGRQGGQEQRKQSFQGEQGPRVNRRQGEQGIREEESNGGRSYWKNEKSKGCRGPVRVPAHLPKPRRLNDQFQGQKTTVPPKQQEPPSRLVA
eukprot:342895-Pelagomonas_calceolata.AAC.5